MNPIRIALTVLTALMLSAIEPASAQDYPIGGATNDEASVVVYGQGKKIAVFVRGTDGALWWNTGAPGTLTPTGWQRIGGVIVGAPSCVSRDPAIIDCFGKSPNNELWHTAFANGAWFANWDKIGGMPLISAPSAMVQTDPQGITGLVVFGQTTAGKLAFTWWKPTTGWQPWTNIQRTAKYAAACGRADLQVWCAYQMPNGPDTYVLRDALNNTPPTPTIIHGDTHYRGAVISDPFSQAKVFVIVTGTDNHLWAKMWRKGLGWEEWKGTTYHTNSAPACVWAPQQGIWCAFLEDDKSTTLRSLQSSDLD